MMTLFNDELEFITPAFLAGADQSRAELRAPSIRGQLRWWFRALGGTHEQESAVFGGVHGGTIASSLIVRTEITAKGPQWNPPHFGPNDKSAYVWYFAKASAYGTRWSSQGVLSPGTKWRLQVLWRSHNPVPELMMTSLRAFLAYGALGLRSSRGLGAFASPKAWRQPDEAMEAALRNAGFRIEDKGARNSMDDAISLIGSLVKGTRKATGWINDCRRHVDTPSPMGGSKPRQASAIRFRPVRSENGEYHIIVFEAPHNRVLGRSSQRNPIVGDTPSRIVPYVAPERR